MNSCVIFAISTCTHACFSHHSQWNNWIIWNQDETADVNQVKTMKSRKLRCSESSGKLWIKWKTISTAVRMFPPRWKCLHRGGNVSTAVEIISTAVIIISTAVEMFPPRWKCFHRGGNVSTAVEIISTAVIIISTAVEMFPPRWKCFHRGGNVSTAVIIISTAVEMFPPRWKLFPPRW